MKAYHKADKVDQLSRVLDLLSLFDVAKLPLPRDLFPELFSTHGLVHLENINAILTRE